MSWKLSRTVLRGGINGDVGPLLDKSCEQVDPATGEVRPYKHPFLIRRNDSAPFCFAGLASLWQAPNGGEPILTAAILTKAASTSTAAVHDRMPVVLPEADLQTWLDPSRKSAAAAAEVVQRAESDFVFYLVRTMVNNARNEGRELIEPL